MGLFKKRFNADALPVWMDPMELAQVTAIFESVQPRKVLEWGCGGSTRELLARFPFIERFVSVEHHPEWSKLVKSRVTDPRLELHHVLADIEPDRYDVPMRKIAAWIDRAETDPTVMQTYVAFPGTLGETFDIVFVDGRGRNFCLKAGWELLNPGGVMILHDAQRPIYQSTLATFPRATFLEPWRQGQVCLVKKPIA